MESNKTIKVFAAGLLIGGLLTYVFAHGVFSNSNSTAALSDAINTDEEKIVALSTFTVLADMVRVVGGDKVESVSLTKPGAEIHGYQPTPGDLVRAANADIFFENGMNLELWTQKLRASIPDVPSVVLSEGITPLPIAEGNYEGKPNPHAWMSPQQGLVYIENIKNALSEIAPEHAEYFNENAQAYAGELIAIDTRLNESLSVLPENNRFMVTCEGAFTYLTNDYGLTEVYLWAINDESGGSPQHIARVIDIVRENEIPAVFCESTVAPKIQQEVVGATDARLGGVLYVDSLSLADGPAPTYLALLESTANTVISGLTGK